jgi:hypothetical protein
MPYINNEKREKYEPFINALVHQVALEIDDDPQDGDHNYVGDLNYIITTLLVKCMPECRYKYVNDAVGILECVKQEYYRRLAAPYEDVAIDKNGDIQVYEK